MSFVARTLISGARLQASRRFFASTGHVRNSGPRVLIPALVVGGSVAVGLGVIGLTSRPTVMAQTAGTNPEDKYQHFPIRVTRLRVHPDAQGFVQTPGTQEKPPQTESENEGRSAFIAKAVEPEVETPQKISLPEETPAVVKEEENIDREDQVVELKTDQIEYIPYLLIGAGTASFAAYRAIKARDPTAKILVIGEENRLPYMRPPLSKELWFPPVGEDPQPEDKIRNFLTNTIQDDGSLKFKQWNGRERSLYYEPEQFYFPMDVLKGRKNGGISIMKGVRVERIDPQAQVAYLSDGRKISYGKCLIATGGKPKNLEVFSGNDQLASKVTLFRKIDDFFNLHQITQEVKDITIIGGGFLGSELACAIAARKDIFGFQVNQIFPEEGNMAKVLPQYLSDWTMQKVKAEGVNVLNHTVVDAVDLDPKDSKVLLTLNNGKSLKTDHVVVAVGIEPEQELARKSDLEIDETLGGYRVNAELEARSNLWVAGDAACFYDPLLGRRRVEHHDHAVVSGRLAGGNMTGDSKPYSHQSMFWSDLGPDVGYEAIGLVDSKLPTVGVFAQAQDKDSPKGIVTATNESVRSESEANIDLNQTPVLQQAAKKTDPASSPSPPPQEDYGKGVIFYLKDDIVVGILMWNVFNRMSVARRVLREHRHYDDLSEVAKLFNIHNKSEE